ncbi:MAG TPA: hypothetical protein VIL90_05585 [Puia sp.]|jgi:hypothetical protein
MKRTRDGRPGPFVDIEATVDDGEDEDEDEDGTDHGTSAEIQATISLTPATVHRGIH